MSRQEQKQLEFGVLWSGAGLVCLAVYTLHLRNAQRERRSDAAVARAIKDWRAEHGQD
jgi:hypothetical protein